MLTCPAASGGARQRPYRDPGGQGKPARQVTAWWSGSMGPGTRPGAQFTIQSMANMLRNMGIQVNPALLKVKNVAAVMVTSSLPPFAKSTQKLDCTISSVGDAFAGRRHPHFRPVVWTGRQGLCPCTGRDFRRGFAVSGASGSGVTKNIPTVGMITGGAVVERSLELSMGSADDAGHGQPGLYHRPPARSNPSIKNWELPGRPCHRPFHRPGGCSGYPTKPGRGFCRAHRGCGSRPG